MTGGAFSGPGKHQPRGGYYTTLAVARAESAGGAGDGNLSCRGSFRLTSRRRLW